MSRSAAISKRLQQVREHIEGACMRAGRDPAEVTLVAVSKRQPKDVVSAAVALGLIELGENYAQELASRRERFPGVRWHFIGHLQRNKVRLVIPGTVLIHSLDSERLARALGKRARQCGLVQEVLVEVGTGEASKSGTPLDEVEPLARTVLDEEGLLLGGLMGMAPFGSSREVARRCFARIRVLRDELEQRLGCSLPRLSMGMSSDLEEAVEEGATLVRVGEAIFGARMPRTRRD